MAETLIKPIETKSAKYLESTLKSTFSHDVCDPSIENCMKGMMNVKKLDEKVGKRQLLVISEIVDSTEKKLKDVISQTQFYHITLEKPEIKKFIGEYREICSSIRKYTESLVNIKDVKDIDVIFRTLTFQVDEYDQAYKEAMKLIGKRKTYDPKSATSKVWSLIKWIWNYKYVLYITGLLLYNTTIYVFPESMTPGLDLFIRVAGTICYTFASDRLAASKLMELVTTMFIFTISGLFHLLLPGIYSKITVPSFLKKIFDIGSSAFFCLFTYFTVDWVSYILKIVCKGILIFGASVKSGGAILEGLWLSFADAAAKIKENLEAAAEYIKISLINGMDVIINMLSKLFSSILYQGVVVPTKDFIFSIPGKLYSKGSSALSLFTSFFTTPEKSLTLSKSTDLLEENVDSIFTAVMGPVSKGRENEIKSAIDAIMILGDKKIESVISRDKELFLHQSVAFMTKKVNDIKEITIKTLENAQQKTENMYKSTFDEMGLTKIWNDLEKLEFRSSYFPYMIGIMFAIAVFHIMFS